MTPDVSFVLVTDMAATIDRVLGALRRQNLADRLELVVVCPGAAALGLTPAHTEGIAATRVVEVDSLATLPPAFAAGAHAASAPVVVIGETHAFPEPNALAAQAAPFADPGVGAVVPTLVNANPATAMSWASLMVTYGRALGGTRREVDSASTHNTAYRRELLLAQGDRLAFRLQLGGGLDHDILSRGYRILYEPAAVFAHLNVANFRSCVADRFHASRCYAAGRSRGWSPPRRAGYALGWPLLPLALGARVVRSRGWAEHRAAMPRGVALPLAVSLVSMALGEAAAYAFGEGRAHESVVEYELHRERHS